MATQTVTDISNTTSPVTIRKATEADFADLYALFQGILREGSTYSYLPEEMGEARSREYWMTAEGTHCFVAESGGQFAGCFSLRPNRTGRGKHVVNASFLVHPDHRGKGVGKAMGRYALEFAKSLGYTAIQYNFVVSVNDVAVRLWKSLGFNIIGTLPQGFRHPTLGLVDVYIMHRAL